MFNSIKNTILTLLILACIIFAGLFYIMFSRVQEVEQLSLTEYIDKTKVTLNDDQLNKFLTNYNQKREDHSIDEFISNLSLKDKIEQMLYISFTSPISNENIEAYIKNHNFGGFYFEKGAVPSTEALLKQINEITTLDLKVKPFIGVSQEGGENATVIWGDNSTAGAYYLSTNDTPIVSYYYGEARAKRFQEYKINMNFSPLLNLQYYGSYTYIRSLSSDPEKVTRLASQIAKGQNENGLISVVKYFPGDGVLDNDPNVSKQLVTSTVDNLMVKDSVPFKKILPEVDAVQISNAIFTAFGDQPASISDKVYKYLSDDFEFKGIAITSDLNAKVYSEDITKYESCLKAGCNMILSSEKIQQFEKIVDSLVDKITKGEISEKHINESLTKILKLKLEYKLWSY